MLKITVKCLFTDGSDTGQTVLMIDSPPDQSGAGTRSRAPIRTRVA